MATPLPYRKKNDNFNCIAHSGPKKQAPVFKLIATDFWCPRFVVLRNINATGLRISQYCTTRNGREKWNEWESLGWQRTRGKWRGTDPVYEERFVRETQKSWKQWKFLCQPSACSGMYISPIEILIILPEYLPTSATSKCQLATSRDLHTCNFKELPCRFRATIQNKIMI